MRALTSDADTRRDPDPSLPPQPPPNDSSPQVQLFALVKTAVEAAVKPQMEGMVKRMDGLQASVDALAPLPQRVTDLQASVVS